MAGLWAKTRSVQSKAASYVELQETGFIWDLHYRGRVCKDTEFVLFAPFMKVDGDEADKLCGKHLCLTGNVAQICHYCECPTAESDNPLARYPFKTKAKIAGSVRENKRDALQELSQIAPREQHHWGDS